MANDTRGRRRSGGRAGRVAAGQAPLEVGVRPVRPGLPGGKFAPLSESDMQQVYDAALGLLEDIGMGSPIEEFVEVVTAAGGHVDDAERLHYPKGVVEGAIATAAKEWVWHGFDDDRSITVGGDRVHFGTAGAAVLMYEHTTGVFPPVHRGRRLRLRQAGRHARSHPFLRPHGGGPRP